MKKQSMITVLLIAVCFLGFSVMCWFHPSKEYSVTERRKLAGFPEISMETLEKGKFMTDFEKYTLDQFPMRDKFRNVKSWVENKILRKSDNNDIYVEDGYVVKMEYPLKEESIKNAIQKFQKIYETYLKDSGSEIYVSVIPDKNYFLAEKSGHLSMDYEKLFEMMEHGMPYAEHIAVKDLLTIGDYYQTDVHWRQEELQDVAMRLADVMGAKISGNYEKRTLDKDFYGVYFGQSALNLPGEKLHYLTNDVIEQCVTYNYENGEQPGIYDFAKAEGNDPYEMFLSGPVSLFTIRNPLATTEKELMVFRDSFGSSLIPLLVEGYAKVTLIDIRYIQSDFLSNFVDFTDKDVLFLYSTVVLNNSETLK